VVKVEKLCSENMNYLVYQDAIFNRRLWGIYHKSRPCRWDINISKLTFKYLKWCILDLHIRGKAAIWHLEIATVLNLLMF